MTSIRIVCLDYYMSAPIPGLDSLNSEFRGSNIIKLPILRIFGSSDKGIKTCLHVHGVFPYIYIPYDGSDEPNGVAYKIASAMDKSLNISMGQASSKQQHIYKVTLVSAIPFYGYHAREHQFFKISFYNPIVIRRACALLQNGTILGKIYQPHECHIPFQQQFMIDYNLHGMNFVRISNVRTKVDRVSTCEQELDVLQEEILNQHEVNEVNPGIKYICDDEIERRRIKGLDTILKPCLSLDRTDIKPTLSHVKWKNVLEDRLKKKSVTRKEVQSSLEESVYAAETPLSQSTLSGTSIDLDVSHFDESILDDTAMDEDVELLMGMLEKKDDFEEEDSILSQVPKLEEEDDFENELDMTMPLNRTPIKMDSTLGDEALDDSLFNSTIMQLDGTYDDEINDKEEKLSLGYQNILKKRFGYIREHQKGLMNNFKESMEDVKKNEIISTKVMLDNIKQKQKCVDDIVQIDGQNGSSDDDDVKVSRKCRTKRRTQFSALDIVVTNSPKKTSGEISSQDICSPMIGKRKLRGSYKEKSKKKLTFNALNETKMDENIACSYKQNRKKIELKDTIETNTIFVKNEHNPISNVETYDTENNVNAIPSTSRIINISPETTFRLDEEKWPKNVYTSSSETNSICGNVRNSSEESTSSPQTSINSLTDNLIFEENKISDKFESSERTLIKLDDADLTLSENSKINLIKDLSEIQDLMGPSNEIIESTMSLYKIPQIHNQDPFYGNPSDVTGSVEVGRNVLKVTTKDDVEEFQSCFSGLSEYQKTVANVKNTSELLNAKLSHCPNSDCIIESVERPPTFRETLKWLENKQCVDLMNVDDKNTNSAINDTCHISGATLNNTYGFKLDLENLQDARSVNEYQYLTTLVVELHIQTRNELKPDPQYDAIRAIFYSILNDVPENYCKPKWATGLIAVNSKIVSPTKDNITSDLLEGSSLRCDITYVESEEELYKKLLELIQFWDPDILVGYEIETLSWGYLIERGYTMGFNLLVQLSRIPDSSQIRAKDDRDEGHSEIRIVGRIVLDLWRLLKHEIALQSYTFENCVYHILHERVPFYSNKQLTNWWLHIFPKTRSRTANYYLYRVKTILKLLNQLDLIGRTSELARLFGIQFFEVLSRGSQFRVESMMLRLAKPANFIPVSPNVQQRANMRAPEYIPLVLEPESKFYKDPVIVLDFQSLYPSMIIAYNYCFSTCLGKVEYLGGNAPFEFGATQLKVSRARVERLASKNLLNYSPCGAVFVKKDVRMGILPRMLQEILNTRLLVKKAMKDEKDNNIMQRVLHSRQLGLKLIANVTYGYTAANFSGRMPSVEVGDSVVSKGRETLQRAITTVESNEKWGARVVYGDTDSLFVLVPGKSREEAFRIGAEIAEVVTLDNPSPVKLKLEKVYQPCILQTKKRYVGYLYESVDQKEPQFDAKGIETIRRDGCPAVSKMLEKCLKLLFDTRDVSLIKKYVVRQFEKLISNRISIQELTFAKEFRGVSGYKPGACVPALELARKWKETDRRNEPRSGERVPYVIINGPPGLPLIKMVRSPRDLLSDSSLRPNALYYITKAIIPAINRCFLLIGVDLNHWFNEMPRKQTQYLPTSSPTKGPKTTISQYFATTNCVCCSKQSKEGICEICSEDSQGIAVILHEKIRNWERNYNETFKICKSCCPMQTNNQIQSDSNEMLDLDCSSLDCPVLYRIIQTRRDLQQAAYVRGIIEKLPQLEF